MNTALRAAPPDSLRNQLEAVRVALLEDARSRATRLEAEAQAEAAAIIAEATADAEGQVHEAEERARASARARADQRLDRVRADAHQNILRTRAAMVDRLVDATHRAALDMRSDPRYPDLLDHLEALARNQLGPDVKIERDPQGRGGITAHVGNRRVDYTMLALSDRALRLLGDDIEQLWT